MNAGDFSVLVALVAVTAFLFGLVEYRRHRPARRTTPGMLTPQEVQAHQQFVARSRAVTSGLQVLAWVSAVPTAMVLVARVAGALL